MEKIKMTTPLVEMDGDEMTCLHNLSVFIVGSPSARIGR